MGPTPERQAVDALQEVGLTAYEAKCFVALARVPKATAKEVSRLADVPRSRVYDSAEGLQARGLVDVRDGTPREFRAVSVDLAVEKLEREFRDHLESVAVALRKVSRPDSRRDHSGIWTVEGRANVVDRGLSLIADADEELFSLVAGEDALEDAWVEALVDATDRGVSVLFASPKASVREDVRKRVPEATIWEPDATLSAFPTDGEQLVRLVMADREAVMIATLGDRRVPGIPSETAVWGQGDANGLVVVLGGMLGARIDDVEIADTDSRQAQP
jgi:sugar-specific transcriptional regulator TrmB